MQAAITRHSNNYNWERERERELNRTRSISNPHICFKSNCAYLVQEKRQGGEFHQRTGISKEELNENSTAEKHNN